MPLPRVAIKQEEAIKQEASPAATAAPAPAPTPITLVGLRGAADAAWALHEQLGAEQTALYEKVQRFNKALERRGHPRHPPPGARQLLSPDGSRADRGGAGGTEGLQ